MRLGAEFLVWSDLTVDWDDYDRVVIRSTWDYTKQYEAFLTWCRSVGPDRLRNRPDLVIWNHDKRYLADLGPLSVPTVFVEPGDPPPALTGEVVIKPNVSAGSRRTGRFGPDSHAGAQQLITAIQHGGLVALVQPHLPSVETRGEISLVFFAGELSHVLHKRAILQPDEVAPTSSGPRDVAVAMLAADLVTAGTATDAEIRLAERVMTAVTRRFGVPLYARIDLLEGPGGSPLLSEIEVIEPHLYLATAPGAAERFAEAIQRD
jgi:hypothetical protein